MPTRGQVNSNIASALTAVIDIPDHLQSNQMILDYVDQEVLAAKTTANTWTTDKPNYYTKTQTDTYVNAKASLVDGKVPYSQLPSDVLEYNNLAAFPVTGEAARLYIAKDTNFTYRWTGSAYVRVAEGAPVSGSSNYIQNQFSSAQSSSNFWVNGKGIVENTLLVGTSTETAGYKLQLSGAARLTSSDTTNSFSLVPSMNFSTYGGSDYSILNLNPTFSNSASTKNVYGINAYTNTLSANFMFNFVNASTGSQAGTQIYMADGSGSALIIKTNRGGNAGGFNPGINYASATGTGSWNIGHNGSGAIFSLLMSPTSTPNSGNFVMHINNSYNIAIHKNFNTNLTPEGQLHVRGQAGGNTFVCDDTSGNKQFRVLSTNSVIVGTGSDSGEKFQVYGTSKTTNLTVTGDNITVATAKTPASASAAGTTGQVAWDADYVYVCVATNTWKRSAITTW